MLCYPIISTHIEGDSYPAAALYVLINSVVFISRRSKTGSFNLILYTDKFRHDIASQCVGLLCRRMDIFSKKGIYTMSQHLAIFEFDRSKLIQNYDPIRLQQETLNIIKNQPPYIHYSVIPLTQAGRSSVDIEDYSDPNWTRWEHTSALSNSPYIQEILTSLDCQKTNVRLLRLEPYGEIKEHSDPQLNLQLRNQVRLHVPIFINEQVEFKLNNTLVPLQPGELWYMRLSDLHSVNNHGNTERIQLSIDVVVNEWVENAILQGDKQ